MLEKWLEKKFGKAYTKEELRSFPRLRDADWHLAFNPPRRFPKGHVREYDPDGIYTYKDQNPRFVGA